MKKKLVVLLLAMTMAMSMTACSGQKDETKKEETTKEGNENQIRLTVVAPSDMDKYVKLGKYKGITVKKEIEEVTEAQIDSQIDSSLTEAAQTVANGVIQEGDIANIDYEGTLDGTAFEGGTDTGYDLHIGTGTFIEGFEEGLIGAKEGEERDLTLTFPEEYPSAELAGKETVFHVKVNEVKRLPEITDEWVKENTGYDNIQAYRDSIRASLEESNKEYAENTLDSIAWNQVMDSCEVLEYPEEDMANEEKTYDDLMAQMAEQEGTTIDEMLKANQLDAETYDKTRQEFAQQMIRQNLIVQAILDKEGLTITGEKGEEALQQLLESYGVSSREEMVSQFGETAVNESIGVIVAGNFVMDNAKVEEVIATADGKDGADTGE